MEDKWSTESGSPGINSEAESPPVWRGGGDGGGGGVVVPELINMAVNLNMERSLGVVPLPVPAATTGGFASDGLVAASGGGVDLSGKKKRGRPRKYDSQGELFADTAGGDFTPHVVNVGTGEDVAAKILAFAQKGPRGICVLSANGAVSNVTIRQPGSSGGLLTHEGRFEILRLTGSFTIVETGGIKSRTGGLSVSLASPDGRVIGGGIAGLLVAASPIQMVVGSFVPNGYKTHKRKLTHEYQMAPIIQGAPDTVTAAKPISQAAPDGSFCLNQASQLPVQSHGEVDNSTSNKDNLNSTSTDSANLSGSEPTSEQRASPDINVSVPAEQL